MSYYDNSLEHIKEELDLLDLKLTLATEIFKNPGISETHKDLAGLVISDQEVQGILKKSATEIVHKSFNGKYNDKQDQNLPIDQKLSDLLSFIEILEDKINQKIKNSVKKNIFLSLVNISRILSLSSFEYYTIIICLAPEIDIKYEKLYAYLQDDVNKKRPTIELALRLLLSSFEDRINVQNIILNSDPFKYAIIDFTDNHQNFLSRPLKLDDQVIRYILGLNYIDSVLNGSLKIFSNQQIDKDKDRYFNIEETKIMSFESTKIKLIHNLLHNYTDNDNNDYQFKAFFSPSFIYLLGKNKCGRKTLVKSILKEINSKIPLLIFDMDVVKNHLSYSLDDVLKSIKIQACLLEANVYLDNFSSILTEESDAKNMELVKRVIWHLRQISNKKHIIFISVVENTLKENASLLYNSDFIENNFFHIKIPDLSFEDRIHLWRYFIQQFNLLLKEEDDVVIKLASKFNFTIGQIKSSINNMINFSKAQESDDSLSKKMISSNELHNACNYESNRKLEQLAIKMNNKFYFNDLVLPEDKKKQLKDIISYVKNKYTVFFKWGFKEKMGLSNGLNILFTGESGTGKTMTSQIIANELEMEIYKIDLSMLVSKYIGETEKNIERIFHEAATSNAIIFFDEADAIFGKRTEIKDSHDRYANIEVNYLLQKLEDHSEIVILASNLKHNIDDAFIRRMNFIVDFPFPNENERLEIWKNIFPEPKFYLNVDLSDLEFFARQFKTSGSMIKNISLTAAFLASSESSNIKVMHLARATKRELEKKGKPIIKSEFGKYYDYII